MFRITLAPILHTAQVVLAEVQLLLLIQALTCLILGIGILVMEALLHRQILLIPIQPEELIRYHLKYVIHLAAIQLQKT